MKTKTTKRVCLTRGKEIFACSSQGFRNENTDTSVNMNWCVMYQVPDITGKAIGICQSINCFTPTQVK